MSIAQKVAAALPAEIKRREATEGKSSGYLATFKVDDDDTRYQVQVAAWLIGSKVSGENPQESDEQVVKTLLAELVGEMSPKTFKTTHADGSAKTGYYCQGKVAVGTQRFQASVTAVALLK